MASVLRLKPGTIIGRDFQIKRLLAKGGMGAVYVAEQLSTASERALKVMHAQLLEDAKSRERFTQEARICARIESDHVVKVIGAGIDDVLETPWIAMELIKGEDLDAVVKARGALPRAEVLEMYRQLCHGLGAAHRIGVVHRDLKLGNILIAESQRSDSPFTVKVLDFGISKVLQEHQTDTTAAVGSPMWMAPEQAQKGKLGPSTDIWPLGLIAFRLLTGKLFWKAANGPHAAIKEILMELLVLPIPLASARVAEIDGVPLPEGFDSWFQRCVVRDPEVRFRSAAEALDALIPVLSGASPLRGRSLWGFGPGGSTDASAHTEVPAQSPPAADDSTEATRVAPTPQAPMLPSAPAVAPVPAVVERAEPAATTTGAVTVPRGMVAMDPPRGVRRWLGPAGIVGVAAAVAAVVTVIGMRQAPVATDPTGALHMAAARPAHQAPLLANVATLALGGGTNVGGHSCARLGDGTVRCWGGNTFGQLGDGTEGASHLVAVTVQGLATVAALSAGGGHTCAVLADATVRCWGRNEFGELGDGTTDNRVHPVAVAGLTHVAEVAAGESHTCARQTDGTVQCWGQNEFGQLGDGTTRARNTPAAVAGITGATALSVRGNHACALVAGGVLKCWGRNTYGELGDGTAENRSEPVDVAGVSGVSQVALGLQHTCAVVADGTVRCWGQNHSGQLGDGTTTNQHAPVTVTGLGHVVQLAMGNEHGCARTDNGSVWCWGSNQHGQLGDQSTTQRHTPVPVVGLAGVQDLALNRNHGCARLADHTVRCWGENEYGELGDGATTDRRAPVGVVQ